MKFGDKHRFLSVAACIAALIPLIVLTFFMRLPALGEAFCNPDVEGIAYSACNFLDGGAIYPEGVETKPPGVYIIFASIFAIFQRSMTPLYAMTSVYHALTALVLFTFVASHFGALEGIFAAYLYAFFSALLFAAGKCPNFETWTLLPLILAWIFVVEAGKRKSLVAAIFAGVCFAIAFAMKQQALIFAALSPPALYYEMPPEDPRKKFHLIKLLAAQLVGALAVLAALTWFIAHRGGLAHMAAALNPLANLRYASSEPMIQVAARMMTKGAEFLVDSWALFLAAAFFAFFGRRLDQLRRDESGEPAPRGTKIQPGRATMKVWLPAAVLAVIAPMKLFDHYLMLLIPPLAVLAGCFLARLARASAIPAYLRVAGLGLAFILFAQNGMTDIKLASSSFENLRILKRQEWTPDHDLYWKRSPIPRRMIYYTDMQKVAACIQNLSTPDDPIYVWDYAPGIYFYAHRKAPTRHFMYFEVATRLPAGSGRWHAKENPRVIAARKELLDDLAASPPKYFVTYNHDASPAVSFEHYLEIAPLFDELQSFYQMHYVRDDGCSTKLFTVARYRK